MAAPKRLKAVRPLDCQSLHHLDWEDIIFHRSYGELGVSFKNIPRIFLHGTQTPTSVCSHYLQWLHGRQVHGLDHIYMRQLGNVLHLFPLDCQTLEQAHWRDIRFVRTDKTRWSLQDSVLVSELAPHSHLSVCERYLQWLYGADAQGKSLNNIELVADGDLLLMFPKAMPNLPEEVWNLVSQFDRTHGVNTKQQGDLATNPVKLRQLGLKVRPIDDVCTHVRLNCSLRGRDVEQVKSMLVQQVSGLLRECGQLKSVELVGNTWETVSGLQHMEHHTQLTAHINELEFQGVEDLTAAAQAYLVDLLQKRPHLTLNFDEFIVKPADNFIMNPFRDRVHITNLLNEAPLAPNASIHDFCAHIDVVLGGLVA